MINIKPVGDQVKIRATGLYQWDEFQTLIFEDPYPEETEVHFSHKGKSIAMVYLLEEGSVQIPNLLLQKASPIMAWVYVDGKTVLEIEIPVERRAMPSGYIGVPDGDQNSIEPRTIALEQWQLEAIDQITDRYTKEEADGLLEAKANKQQVGWISATLLNGTTGNFKYRKNEFGNLEIMAKVVEASVGAWLVSLPINYRVSVDRYFPVVASDGTVGRLLLNDVGAVAFSGSLLTNKSVDLFLNIPLT